MRSELKVKLDIVGPSGKQQIESVERAKGSVLNTVRAGQQVQVEGRSEMFVVLHIDHARHLADLLRLGAVRKVENGIPLALLKPLPRADEVQDMGVSA